MFSRESLTFTDSPPSHTPPWWTNRLRALTVYGWFLLERSSSSIVQAEWEDRRSALDKSRKWSKLWPRVISGSTPTPHSRYNPNRIPPSSPDPDLQSQLPACDRLRGARRSDLRRCCITDTAEERPPRVLPEGLIQQHKDTKLLFCTGNLLLSPAWSCILFRSSSPRRRSSRPVDRSLKVDFSGSVQHFPDKYQSRSLN